MKKPINKVALVLWVVAVLVALSDSFEIWTNFKNMKDVATEAGETYLVVETLVRGVAALVLQSALLVGLGTLIEIVDRIHWNTQKLN